MSFRMPYACVRWAEASEDEAIGQGPDTSENHKVNDNDNKDALYKGIFPGPWLHIVIRTESFQEQHSAL